jgi:hypothetical protein
VEGKDRGAEKRPPREMRYQIVIPLKVRFGLRWRKKETASGAQRGIRRANARVVVNLSHRGPRSPSPFRLSGMMIEGTRAADGAHARPRLYHARYKNDKDVRRHLDGTTQGREQWFLHQLPRMAALIFGIAELASSNTTRHPFNISFFS